MRFLILTVCLLASLYSSATQQAEKDKELKTLQAQINDSKKWLNQAKKQQSQQQTNLEQLEKKMAANLNAISKSHDELSKLQNQQQQQHTH